MGLRILALVFLAFLASPASAVFSCYVTHPSGPQETTCVSNQICGTHSPNQKLTYGCFTPAQCEDSGPDAVLTDPKFCCEEDRCNSPTGVLFYPRPPTALSNQYPRVRTLVSFGSEWRYFVTNATSGPEVGWQTGNVGSWQVARGPIGTSNVPVSFLANQAAYNASNSIFFRRNLAIDQATNSTIQRFVANLVANDGIAIYINGVEVYRYNLLSNAAFNAVAIVSNSNGNKQIAVDLPVSGLLVGDNSLAVEIHKGPSGDVDMYMDLELLAVVPTNRTFPSLTSVLAKGAEWRYSTSGDPNVFIDPLWLTSFYDDSAWPRGTGPFGDATVSNRNTTLTYAGDPVLVTYFRQLVTVPSNAVGLEANIRCDNGFVLYINGVELLRRNLPGGNLTAASNSLAKSSSPKKDVYTRYSELLSPEVLGQVIIAVAVFHQSGATTPDISFDLELLAPSRPLLGTACSSPFDANMENTGPFPFDHQRDNVPCVFPFIFQGVERTACITTPGRSKPWCSMTSNYDIDGVWGYCNPCAETCRSGCNQVGARLYPSCYTDTETFEWGYCDMSGVTPTPTAAKPPVVTASPPPTSTENQNVGAIAGSIGAVAAILLAALGVYLYLDWKKKAKLKRDIENLIAAKTDNSGQAVTMQVASYQPSFYNKNPFPNHNPEDFDMDGRTLMNTMMEKALPGFLLLTDLASQIRIGKVINKGGNGILYEGVIVDPILRSRTQSDAVAVKKIEYSQPPEEAIEAFHHEITVMWSLFSRPNVIPLLAYDDATTSIVTPLYDGDLEYFLHKNSTKLVLDDRMLIYLAQSIAKGMSCIHDVGIIHRDLKPGNVLLKFLENSLPEVIICDFGIARIADNHTIVNQKKYELFGLSPRYAAPETFARMYTKSATQAPADTERLSDVYSYSVILWELLTRKIPWDGMSTGDIELNVRAGKCPPDPHLGSPARAGLDALMKNCRSLEPTQRLGFGTIVQRLKVFAENTGLDITGPA